MKIVTVAENSGLLRSVSQLVTDLKAVLPLCQKMQAFVSDPKNGAIGLAAVQMGEPVRAFVAKFAARRGFRESVRIFINPVIKETYGKAILMRGRSLSEPGVVKEVWRPEFVRISYTNEKGEWTEQTYLGLDARIILHEMDHLEGILLQDKK
jgi:peptide deformylase